jgi:hypothetical protein
MTMPRDLVDRILVPHEAFKEGLRRIDQCYRNAEVHGNPACLAIVGPSRTGKTSVLEQFASGHQTTRTAEGLNIPILRVKTPSKPTVKSLVEIMLREMGDPRFDKGTENVRTGRLMTLIRNCGTRMVMIDEFQHFYDKGQNKVMHHAADWLKVLVDDTRVGLVVAGLPGGLATIEQNEQLRGRFRTPVKLERFDWRNPADREEFVAILSAFYDALAAHVDLPDLTSAGMAFRLYCATGGLIGYLATLLSQTVWDVVDENQAFITLGHLRRAFANSVRSTHDYGDAPDPFGSRFSTEPSEELLAKVAQIGTAMPAATEGRPLRRRRAFQPQIRDVLSAS